MHFVLALLGFTSGQSEVETVMVSDDGSPLIVDGLPHQHHHHHREIPSLSCDQSQADGYFDHDWNDC